MGFFSQDRLFGHVYVPHCRIINTLIRFLVPVGGRFKQWYQRDLFSAPVKL